MRTVEIIWNAAAIAGIVLTVVQFWMKTMIPLRVLGIVTNVLFLIYSSLAWIWPTFVLNCIVLPLNAYRLHEMRELIRKTQAAAKSDFDMSALEPFMSRRPIAAGETLFKKGDLADAMYLVVSGRLQLPETGIEIKPGTVVGELGLLAPGRTRTQSLVVLDAGEVRVLPYETFEQLYFQNPQFGLAFLKLTSQRLFQNIARLEEELAARTAEVRRLRAAASG
ncbi:MAG: cyclic nucleotide-binding domain-containing protein [Bradyrhizobiaceae bacterium]|nr:cyclic nucleotide-binding domain-containing protein [Bradyrhizobiaceae bacterium]